MKYRTTRSALLVAGAAAGVAAAAWVGTRRQKAVATPNAAPDQNALPRHEDEQTAVRCRPQLGVAVSEDISFDEIWDTTPRSAKDAQTTDEAEDPNDVQEDDLDIDEKRYREP